MRNKTFPQIQLATQVIINCRGGGSCNGGNPGGVYARMECQTRLVRITRYVKEGGDYGEGSGVYFKIPVIVFQAKNGECHPLGICETCSRSEGVSWLDHIIILR